MNYSQEIKIIGNAEKAFTALTKELHLWWGVTEKPVSEAGDIFKVFFGKAFWQFRVDVYEPGKRVSWSCIDGQPSFEHEWVGTRLHWTINELDSDSVTITFVHEGLTRDFDCYDVCAPTWDLVITGSLKQFIETGVGEPLST